MADLWLCGVILFVLLAGFLPFEDENLMRMYRKVFKAEYQIRPWFSANVRRLVSRLLVADPEKRISIPAIVKLPWFQKGFSRSIPLAAAPSSSQEGEEEGEKEVDSPRFYNAFELISAILSGFDLSSLFESRRRELGRCVVRWISQGMHSMASDFASAEIQGEFSELRQRLGMGGGGAVPNATGDLAFVIQAQPYLYAVPMPKGLESLCFKACTHYLLLISFSPLHVFGTSIIWVSG